MIHRYSNPPIIESLCEFYFEPSQPWDWTVPGLLYDKLKGAFPRKQQMNSMEVEVHNESGGISQNIKGGTARMQFLREDGKALVQVGPDLLVINHLKPYAGWDQFRADIDHCLATYFDTIRPVGVRQIGLRYINRIEIPSASIQIDDYLLAVPRIPPQIPRTFTAWVQRVEIPYTDANGLLVLQSGSLQEGQDAHAVFLLDLYFISSPEKAVGLSAALDTVEQAHQHIETAFEASVTDNARKIFGEE
ncbi:MAG: TIGR04255 family protein [Chloroflexi bacterium]|nr:TIGR04255 family protein [Chloroflexota bacterium]MCL5274474.1 TIGR04255 family protein [Chloroflexota bacterium]